ncbi:MAG: hypothetical protein ACPGSB_05305 [Opitutales bacterium]
MNKLCTFVGMTVFGWISWLLGEKVGLMTAFALSLIGSLPGVYIGWKVTMNYFS